MRLILISVAALVSTGLPPAATAYSLDTPVILADDGEKKTGTENDDENVTGDEEPECE